MATASAEHALDDLDKESSDEATDPYTSEANMPPGTPNMEHIVSMPDGMARAMEEFRTTAELAKKLARDRILPQEETDGHYAKMAQTIEEILDYMYSADNAYSFLQAKGLDKIVAPNLHIEYPPLRMPLLQLLKAFFDIAPTTTVSVIPNHILDKLVDIFEKDDNVSIKIHAIELLSIWLPGNPVAQTRVMKMKGFEPFYKQLTKWEAPLTKLTLELFITILNEHIVERNKKIMKNKADYRTWQLYQQIGLIERMSTPTMCNGLMYIFQEVFSFGSADKDHRDMLPLVLKLLRTIKPHCSKVFQGNSEIAILIEQMLKYLEEPDKRLHLKNMGVNVTAVIEDLTDFANLVKLNVHTEL